MEPPGQGCPRARQEGGGHERLAGALPADLNTGENTDSRYDRYDGRVKRLGSGWSASVWYRNYWLVARSNVRSVGRSVTALLGAMIGRWIGRLVAALSNDVIGRWVGRWVG